MSFYAALSIGLKAQMTGALDIERLASSIDKNWLVELADGTGADQAQRMWSDTRTLAGGASETLDLIGNTLRDAFGAILSLDKVKMIIVVAAKTNTTTLTIGNVVNGIVDPFLTSAGGVLVRPGGVFVSVAPGATGFPLVSATQDLINVANAAGAAASYDIVIVGI